jgi:hypothetical protein
LKLEKEGVGGRSCEVWIVQSGVLKQNSLPESGP